MMSISICTMRAIEPRRVGMAMLVMRVMMNMIVAMFMVVMVAMVVIQRLAIQGFLAASAAAYAAHQTTSMSLILNSSPAVT